MSGARYADRLPWDETRRAAAVLRAARLASGIRQADVAALAGWSAAKVYHMELAVSRMTPAGALTFAAAVGVTEAELGLTGGAR